MYYVGGYEKEVIEGGDTNEYDYIYSPEGLSAIAIKTGGVRTLYYIHIDHLGSLRVVTTQAKAIQSRYYYDAWGARTLITGTSITNRGFTGHEHLPEFGFINMNARLYDPVLGRFLAMDSFVQMPDFTQAFNRYSYGLNNPLIYTDPTGEFIWIPIIIGAVLYGTENTIIHYNNGDIDNFWQGLGYFATGAVVGAIAGATWSVGLAGIGSSSTLAQIGGWSIMGTKAINAISTVSSAISNPENAWKIMWGKAYVDDGWGGLLQGISRNTWEGLQSWAGYNYTQFRNAGGNVDRVDYFGGVTWATKENDRYRGLSFGNYINMSIDDEITSSFQDRVLSDPWFMHEYGHYLQSRSWGPAYLFGVGIPSAIAAGKSSISVPNDHPYNRTMDDIAPVEMRANKKAEKYFRTKYGVNWDYLSLTDKRFWKFPLRYP